MSKNGKNGFTGQSGTGGKDDGKDGKDEGNPDLDYDYLVYPDYLEEEVLKRESLSSDEFKSIKILSHNNISKDPILKAESRYDALINEMK